jgi:hypothetical protein
MLSKIQGLDIQFGQRFEGEKARRLVEELRRLQTAVNAIVDEVNSAASAGTTPVLTAHELASETGLGADHTVHGLTAGHVLQALSATAAAFQQMRLGQIARMNPGSVDGAVNGDMLQVVGGFWSAVPASPLLTEATPGFSSVLGWDQATAQLVWRAAGPGITLSATDIESTGGGTTTVDDSEFVSFFNGQ